MILWNSVFIISFEIIIGVSDSVLLKYYLRCRYGVVLFQIIIVDSDPIILPKYYLQCRFGVVSG